MDEWTNTGEIIEPLSESGTSKKSSLVFGCIFSRM